MCIKLRITLIRVCINLRTIFISGYQVSVMFIIVCQVRYNIHISVDQVTSNISQCISSYV